MKKKWVKWLLVIMWMIVIFMFSSQNGTQSDQNNRFLVDLLKNIGINLDILLGSVDNFIIRKLAHMTEYFILFNLIYNAINEEYKFIRASVISLISVFLYACTDEFHQSFIPGRGPSFRDVLIDTSGGGMGLLVRGLIHRRRVRKRVRDRNG